MRNTRRPNAPFIRQLILYLIAPLPLLLTGLHGPQGSDGGVHFNLSVTSLGAVGDGKTICTRAIQAAIDSCSKSGGGTVVVPPGKFVTGSLVLGSGVNLHLDTGAILLGSTLMSDYPSGVLILAQNADSVGLSGDGVIDGNGKAFWDNGGRAFVRPNGLLRFVKCVGVAVTDIRVINSPKFTIYLDDCSGVRVEGIQIRNSLDSPNTDGIDVANSSDVLISGCYMETGDDAVCLKSNRRGAVVSHVIVRDCRLVTDDTALKLGTGSKGTISDCTFTNIIVPESTNGIGLFMKDGGTFERIEFSNIRVMSSTRPLPKYFPPDGGAAYWLKVLKKREAFPIFVDSESRNHDSPVGTIRDVLFQNLTIRTYDGNCLLEGRKEKPLDEITMNHIRMTVLSEKSYLGRRKPRGTHTLPGKSPNDFSYVPSYFTFAYVKGLKLNDIAVRVSKEAGSFPMYCLWGKSVEGATVDSVNITDQREESGMAVMMFSDSRNVRITACPLPRTRESLIDTTGN